MRSIFKTGIVAFLFLCCGEDEFPGRQYPYVVMAGAEASDGGVELVAEFKTLGSMPIRRFGFLWWEGTDAMDSSDFCFRELGAQPKVGNFSLTVDSDLAKDREYSVRPFAENDQVTVLGDVFVFKGIATEPPAITGFSPKNGGPGDTITITGSGFSLSPTRIEVYVGTDKCILVSTDRNEILFRLPADLSVSGEVPLSLKSGDAILVADDLFLLEGHVVADFTPGQGIIGEAEITIAGSGFLETGNIVRIGEYEVVILQESRTEIRVRLPFQMKVGVLPVTVEVNGQAATASGEFTVRSRWTRLADFPGAPRLNPFYAVVGNFLYIIGGQTNTYSDEVWKYDIANDSWVRLSDFPGGGRSGGTGFAIGTTIYYGLGVGSSDDFWSFDTATGQWTETYGRGSLLTRPLAIAIDGTGYLLTDGYYSFTRQDGWTYLGRSQDLDIDMRYDSFFEIGADLYIWHTRLDANTGQRIHNLYKAALADPTNWTLVIPLQVPLERHYNAISFASGDFAYIGEGVSSMDERMFVRYDVTTNQWTQIENFQGPLMVRDGVSFTYNGKGYVGFGLVDLPGPQFSSSNQMWVYDPSIE